MTKKFKPLHWLALGLCFCSGAVLALAPLTGISKVAAGSFHTCVLTTTGGVKCWGSNSTGQAGQDLASFQVNTATDVPGLTSGVIAIAAGGSHSCALTSGGGVKCWGLNQNGQLGDNATSTIRATPADVVGLTSGVVAISAGLLTTCAVTSTGAAKCWGANGVGQLGDNSTTQRDAPVDVSGLGAGVTDISTYNGHSCALVSGGGVKCWGQNNSGQLGDNTTTNSPVPVTVISAPSSGALSGMSSLGVMFSASCAMSGAGGVLCWGDNLGKQLGNNLVFSSSHTPVGVLSGPSLPALTGVTAFAASRNEGCVVLTSTGAKCWGQNTSGQLGAGDNDNFSHGATPLDVVSNLALTPLTGITGISAGETHACAVMSDTGVKCWGANIQGQIGNNAVGSYQFIPVDALVASVALSAVQSRKTHGALGGLDVPIDKNALVTGLVSTEPRNSGGNHLIVFQFDGAVNSVTSVAATDSANNPIGGATATTAGNDVLVLLAGIGDNSRVKISLTGVNGSVDTSAAMGFLIGDVNSSRTVSASDIISVKAHPGSVTGNANAKFDVNLDGVINNADVSQVKLRSGSSLVP